MVNTDPGTIETSGSYNGIDDVVIVTDEPIAGNATHTYTVTVRFTLDLPDAATQPDPSDCSLIEGSEDGTGLFNDANSSFNGYRLGGRRVRGGRPGHAHEVVDLGDADG